MRRRNKESGNVGLEFTLVGIPVWATSWGAGRSQTVVSKDPFAT